MILIKYDKTFDGFLTSIFDVYEKKILPEMYVGNSDGLNMLWTNAHNVSTNIEKSERVWQGLKKKLSPCACDMIYRVHLSGAEDAEIKLFRFISKVFYSKINIEENYGDIDVLGVIQLDKKIIRESQRVTQFVRFQQTADEIYFAAFDPEYNVLPISIKHFEDRFSDQKWMIYDSRRRYGFFFNGIEMQMVTLDSDKIDYKNGTLDQSVLAEDEVLYQKLWKQYFHSICIDERRNLKLHVQHMPKRFWKYLTEKREI